MKNNDKIYNQINEIYNKYYKYDFNENEEIYEKINILGTISNLFKSVSKWIKRNFSPKISKIHDLADQYEKALYEEYKRQYLENDAANYFRASKLYYDDLNISNDILEKIEILVGDDDYFNKLAKNIINQKNINVKEKILNEMKLKASKDSDDPKKIDELSKKIKEKKENVIREYDDLIYKNNNEIKKYENLINNLINQKIKNKDNIFFKMFFSSQNNFDENKCYSFLYSIILMYESSSEYQKNTKEKNTIDNNTFIKLYNDFTKEIMNIYDKYNSNNIEIISYDDIISNIIKNINFKKEKNKLSEYSINDLFNDVKKNIYPLYKNKYQELLDKELITKNTENLINIDNQNISKNDKIDKNDKYDYTNKTLSIDDVKKNISDEKNVKDDDISIEDAKKYINEKITKFFENEKDIMIENINQKILNIKNETDQNIINKYKILNENCQEINITLEKDDKDYEYLKIMIFEDFPQIAGLLYFQKFLNFYKNPNYKQYTSLIVFDNFCKYISYIILAKITDIKNVKKNLSKKMSQNAISKVQKYLNEINNNKKK